MLSARLRGVARPRYLVVVAVVLVTAPAPAVASWTVPGTGSGVAQASPDFHAPSVNSATIAPVGMTAAGGGVRAGQQFVVVHHGRGVMARTIRPSADPSFTLRGM